MLFCLVWAEVLFDFFLFHKDFGFQGRFQRFLRIIFFIFESLYGILELFSKFHMVSLISIYFPVTYQEKRLMKHPYNVGRFDLVNKVSRGGVVQLDKFFSL